ncbi:MAG: UvrB/UvrC motif-containing protein [Phycisphaerae bacterium]|jgi:protein arginine kinase activator
MGLCERCQKAQATFHLTNIDPSGTKQERHLCERCAVEEGLIQVPNTVMNIEDVLQTVVSKGKSSTSALADLVCEECGISYVEFRNHGLLGCPADYDAFESQLKRLLERAHDGGTHHVGKVPKGAGEVRTSQQDLHRLKRLLNEAVAAEDYERAATLRDQIRELEEA